MRDFSCCGLTLPSLHDLLQHYEEEHAQRSSQPSRPATLEEPQPDSRAAIASNTAAAVQQEAQRQQASTFKPIAPAQAVQQPSTMHQPRQRPIGYSTQLQTIPDVGTVDDMEMDDAPEADEKTPPSNLYTRGSMNQSPRTQFNSPTQPRAPQLNMNMMPGTQAFRHSTPSTPIAAGRSGFATQNNPTVSSVNTPTLTANPMQQQFQSAYNPTPDSSAPGTPGEPDEDLMGGMDDMNMQSNPSFMSSQPQNLYFGPFGMSSDMLDLCIDEPAKRLFSQNGRVGPQQQEQSPQPSTHARLGSGQYGPNSEIARKIREQQMAVGLPDTASGLLPHEEPKPFRCPVIGCEKAYKNQNGLKYHKSVSYPDPWIPPDFSHRAAWSQQSAIARQRRWDILHRRPGDFGTVSRHDGHGEGEALSMRGVWQTLQEFKRPEIPQVPFSTVQSRAPDQRRAPGIGGEDRFDAHAESWRRRRSRPPERSRSCLSCYSFFLAQPAGPTFVFDCNGPCGSIFIHPSRLCYSQFTGFQLFFTMDLGMSVFMEGITAYHSRSWLIRPTNFSCCRASMLLPAVIRGVSGTACGFWALLLQ